MSLKETNSNYEKTYHSHAALRSGSPVNVVHHRGRETGGANDYHYDLYRQKEHGSEYDGGTDDDSLLTIGRDS